METLIQPAEKPLSNIISTYLNLNMLLMITEKQMTFLVSSTYDNISIKFGITQADFQWDMLHWT